MSDIVLSGNVDYSKALTNPEVFEQSMKTASLIAKSTFIPKQFQGNPSDCLIALMMGAELKVNPISLMSELYVVHGRPSMSAKFLIAQANRHGPFTTPIQFDSKGTGDSLKVRAYAGLKDGSTAEAHASMAMAKTEGWANKNPKYKSMPEHMLEYRAATFLVRKYCPEVAMGLITDDEATDLGNTKQEKAAKIEQATLPPAELQLAPADQVDKMLAAFKANGNEEAEVLDFLGLETKEAITENDLNELRKLYKENVAGK